jgi:DNA-binding SARP family transcriptional activator
MLVEGKFVKPLAYCADVHRNALRARLGAPDILIEAPSGYLLTGCLAALLEEAGKQIIWLRLGPEDVDPASCLWSLVMAAQQVDRQAGLETLYRMQRLPGPLQGWPGLFELLARDCAGRFTNPTTWVFEHTHHLARSPQTLALLANHFIRLLPEDQQVILIAQERLPLPRVRKPFVQVNGEDLSLRPKAMESLLQKSGVRLQSVCARRAAELAQGRAVALLGICNATQSLGEPWVERCLQQSQSLNETFSRTARTCMTSLDRHGQEAVNILAFLGYDHPAINQSITGEASMPSGPWAQSLSQSWIRPYHLWHHPLKTAVGSGEAFCPPVLGAAADYLCRNDAALNGIGLLFEINCLEQAAYYLAHHAAQLLSCGFWETIHNWLDLLPSGMLIERPWLLLASAEIKSCSGDLHGAMRIFEQASERFAASAEPRGAIASLLALSATAAWTGDQGKAWGSADGARCLAEAAHLFGQQAWAEFQLACLAAREGDLQPAAAHFRDAAGLALQTDEPYILDCIRSLEALVGEQQRLYALRLSQQKVYQECERAEQQGARRLAQALQSPRNGIEGILTDQDWLQIPLFFKLAGNASRQENTPGGGQGLKGWLRRLWTSRVKDSEPFAPVVVPIPEVVLPCGADHASSLLPRPRAEQEAMRIQPAGINLSLEEPGERTEAAIVVPAELPTPVPAGVTHSLTAYLLDGFRLGIEDKPVQTLPGGRSGMLLKYLVFHHQRQMPRELLMDQFWPEAEPEIARNRLNVAMSGLRQALRVATENEIIVFQDGKYGLSPSWEVWVDVDEFERYLEKSRRLEAAGEAEQAIHCLEVAANLYQGDFLQDDPYEEWTVSIRERLRLAYLDALYQLSRHYFQTEQNAACAALCQTILARDACREDVHCLLMRCYARQNQVPLALRQYQACVEALRRELEVEPARATMALYEQLRRREQKAV